MKRVNLGCGPVILDGYLNVDLFPPADIIGDVRTLWLEGVEEVVARHFLEHVSYRDTDRVLERIRSWMQPGARLVLEVPDMAVICREPEAPWFQLYVYGCQAHPGEVHLAGFTERTLMAAAVKAGFKVIGSRSFLSTEPQRAGLPCTEVEAVA